MNPSTSFFVRPIFFSTLEFTNYNRWLSPQNPPKLLYFTLQTRKILQRLNLQNDSIDGLVPTPNQKRPTDPLVGFIDTALVDWVFGQKGE